jgi:hypothetical protein
MGRQVKAMENIRIYSVGTGKFELIRGGYIDTLEYARAEKIDGARKGDAIVITSEGRFADVEVTDIAWKECHMGTDPDGVFYELDKPYWIEHIQFKLIKKEPNNGNAIPKRMQL